MGRVAGSYGVRGWVKLAPDRGAGEALAAAKEWWIGAQAYRVREAKLHGAAVVGKLAGIEMREQALALKGSAVSVRRGSLPEPGEGHYYLADLVGLEVVNERGEALGVVKRLFTNGVQDVMELAGERARVVPGGAAGGKNLHPPNPRAQGGRGADRCTPPRRGRRSPGRAARRRRGAVGWRLRALGRRARGDGADRRGGAPAAGGAGR